MIGIENFPLWLMKKIIVQIKSLTIAICCLVTNIMAYEIEHLEPPFWWTGMESEKLQLMVHGRNISFLQPQIEYEGVEILRVNRMENNNYMFIDLSLKDAVAGSFDIQFIRLGKVEAEYRYVLRERDSNSKNRKGFDPGDVIYLITPDRYANGDKKNDDVSGLKEKSRREDKDGRHEDVGCAFLKKYFKEDVLGPIKYHVKAKKYLARDRNYYRLLSKASKISLKLQGGIMNDEEAKNFESNKFFKNSIKLRKFDEMAKKSNIKIKSITDYKKLLISQLI